MHTQHCKRSNGTLHHALAALEQNEQAQDAIVRTLTVIGEAAVRIQKAAPEFVAAHPELPWSPMRVSVTRSFTTTSMWHGTSFGIPSSKTSRRYLSKSNPC